MQLVVLSYFFGFVNITDILSAIVTCINVLIIALTPLANGHIHIDLSISLHPIGHLKLVAECNIPFVDLRFSGVFRVCGAFSDSNNAWICLIDVSNLMA